MGVCRDKVCSISLKLNSPDKNITSIEDPIENKIDGINQAQVNPKAGLTFASALKSILRQDPDIVMVGEIRDRETAEIAIRAAITGHLVLSTLHTNTAAGAITRLVDLGIEPFLVASALQGIMAQRLVRRICPDCRNEETKGRYRGAGCESCRLSGYKGRIGIFELAPISEQSRSLICQAASEEKIIEQWRSEGVRPLEEDGMSKVHSGQTSLEEIKRVTG